MFWLESYTLHILHGFIRKLYVIILHVLLESYTLIILHVFIRKLYVIILHVLLGSYTLIILHGFIKKLYVIILHASNGVVLEYKLHVLCCWRRQNNLNFVFISVEVYTEVVHKHWL